jgi:L-fucose isomerase-like protein
MFNVKPFKPLLGLCPIGKFVFSNEDAVRQKQALQQALRGWGISWVDLDEVVEDGLIKNQQQVDTAVEHFRRAGVNALFLPHCNFGTEGAAGMIAKKLGVPTLLWGPRDEAPLPDGSRLRDTLCGLFATSKVLHKLGVPFTYIENCRVDDAALQAGLDTFLRAASVADLFRRGTRVGMVGGRIDFFWTTIINESELLERFNVEIIPFDMYDFIQAALKRAKANRVAYAEEILQFRSTHQVEGMDESNDALINVLGVRDQLLSASEEHGLDGLAFRNFMSVIEATGAYCSYAENHVTERYPFGYEADVHGVLSDLMLRRARMDEAPAWLTEFVIRHPTNDNAALLWHEGAPLSMCDPTDKLRLGYHWILRTQYAGMDHFRLKPGPITVARFDGDHGRYQLALGEGLSTTGPDTLNNYLWVEVEDWARWERRLIEGPFIHHLAMSYGRFAAPLKEACKFIPGLEPLEL